MRRDKENGGNPSRTLQYQVAKLLEKVGGESANLHVCLDQRLTYEPGEANKADWLTDWLPDWLIDWLID